MQVVRLSLKTSSGSIQLGEFDAFHTRRQSLAIYNILGNNKAAVVEIQLANAAPAAVKYVLKCIAQNQQKRVHIKVQHLPLVKAVAIYEAIEMMIVQPFQFHVEGHINGYISHKRLTVTEIMVVHKVFDSRQSTSKTWRVLVHQVAWDCIHQKYCEEQKKAIKQATRKVPTLFHAINAKVKELRSKGFPKQK